MAFARDDEVRNLHAVRQADETGDQCEPRLYPRPEHDQTACEAPGGPGTGDTRDVDTGVAAVPCRDVGQAPSEGFDLGRGGALLGAEHGGRVEEGCRHVAGHDELDPVQRRR